MLICLTKKDNMHIQTSGKVIVWKVVLFRYFSSNISFLAAFITPISLSPLLSSLVFLSSVLLINYTIIWTSDKQHTTYHQTIYSLEPYHLCIHLMNTSWLHCRFSTTSPSSIIFIKVLNVFFYVQCTLFHLHVYSCIPLNHITAELLVKILVQGRVISSWSVHHQCLDFKPYINV